MKIKYNNRIAVIIPRFFDIFYRERRFFDCIRAGFQRRCFVGAVLRDRNLFKKVVAGIKQSSGSFVLHSLVPGSGCGQRQENGRGWERNGKEQKMGKCGEVSPSRFRGLSRETEEAQTETDKAKKVF